MSTLSRGYFSTRQTIPAFNRWGDATYVQQMKFIEGNRCWYKLELSALHLHLLEQIQSYIERTSLGWGSSRSLPKFKVIAKVTQCHIKVKLFWRSFKVISRSNLKLLGRTCKVISRSTSKQCSIATKIRQISNAS